MPFTGVSFFTLCRFLLTYVSPSSKATAYMPAQKREMSWPLAKARHLIFRVKRSLAVPAPYLN